MTRDNLKFLVPNGITFLSLAFGVGAILAAAQENLIFSGALIFSSYFLDMLDGFSARKLDAQSEFGLQLDSLVDLVSLGVAPALLAFHHVRLQGVSISSIGPVVIFMSLAGAFRLARFNLLPPKISGSKDSAGLPITQSGGTLVTAVLADTVHEGNFLPAWAYVPLLGVLSLLMVSTIPFPSASWFFRKNKKSWVLIVILVILLIVFPVFYTWFSVYMVYLIVSIGRAIFMKKEQEPQNE